MLTNKLGVYVVDISNEKEENVKFSCVWRTSNEDVYHSFMVNVSLGQKRYRTKTLSEYKSAQRDGAERQARFVSVTLPEKLKNTSINLLYLFSLI